MDLYQELLAECDADIRSGSPERVRRRLSQLTPGRIPRRWRAPLAKICRRAGLYSIGLSLLERLVHAKRLGTSGEATAIELAEFAALLLRSGAIREAQEYLENIDAGTVPDVLLFRAFSHFVSWQFADAIPLLESYLRAPLSPYSSLVGRTNLGYALVETRQHEKALSVLNDVIYETEKGRHSQLSCTNQAFKAQCYFQMNEFALAREEIEIASRLFDNSHTNDQFLVRKWRLILDGVENRSLAPFEELKSLATKARDWASLREADFYGLKVKFNMATYMHLYCGSPFAEFRKLITDEVASMTKREHYVYGEKLAPRLDLSTGFIDNAPALNPSGMCLRMLNVLLKDFYQPPRLAAIFAELFPGEHFFVTTSSNRVHQVIRRTRTWLEENNIPAVIRADEGFYKVSIEGRFSFRVPFEQEHLDATELQYASLASNFGSDQPFSARQARDRLGLSKTTINRLLSWAIEHGKIVRLNDSSRTRYTILHPDAAAKKSA